MAKKPNPPATAAQRLEALEPPSADYHSTLARAARHVSYSLGITQAAAVHRIQHDPAVLDQVVTYYEGQAHAIAGLKVRLESTAAEPPVPAEAATDVQPPDLDPTD